MLDQRELALVGNDVIDFAQARALSHHDARHVARFKERVLAPDELAEVEQAAEPERLLWTFFAAKEAAYKVIVKLRPRVVFAQRAFRVTRQREEVHYEDLTFRLAIEQHPEYVHALAWLGASEPTYRIATIARNEHAGCAARRLASRYLATRLGCARSQVRVVRPRRAVYWDQRAPPEIVLEQGVAPLDVSLSHHGRLVAVAALSWGKLRVSA